MGGLFCDLPKCMERPKRAATKVTDFRRYHLSGNLEDEVHGLVGSRITQFSMSTAAEQLKAQIEAEKENSKRLEEEAQVAELQHQLELEKMKQEEWRTALQKLEEAK